MAMDSALMTKADSLMLSEARASKDRWDLLASDEILLAHRQDSWKESDPQIIRDWFEGNVGIYGERLRRVCRYLKAWRDYHELDGVSSILLMACAIYSYENNQQSPIRDDLALKMVMSELPTRLSKPIKHPFTDETFDARMTKEQRAAAVSASSEAAAKLDNVIDRCGDGTTAIRLLRDVFGPRVPSRSDLVALSVAAQTVFSKPAQTVPKPAVGTHRSA
jgi:hypothetical protein